MSASTRTRRPPPNQSSIKGVLLSAATNSEGGFLIVPALFSDVTIFMDAATRYAYVVNFSHVDILRLNARTETVIGVTEMEELDPENDSSPDYDELETTGNETSTRYTPTAVTTTVRNDKDKEATTVIDAESITHTVDKSEVRQTADKVVQKVNSTTVAVADNKVTLGDENATEPLVLGNELAPTGSGVIDTKGPFTLNSKTLTDKTAGSFSNGFAISNEKGKTYDAGSGTNYIKYSANQYTIINS